MQRDFFDKSSVGVVNNDESLTVPDDSYTIKDLIRRYQAGCMPNVGRNVIYDDEPDIDNCDPTCDPAFDLVDREELSRDLAERIPALQRELEEVNKVPPKPITEEQKESEE